MNTKDWVSRDAQSFPWVELRCGMDARLKMAATAEKEIPMPMADFTTLEKIRLRLRHFTDAELATFIAYRNDPEVAKYQSWTEIGKSEAHAFIQEQKQVQPGDAY